MRKEKAMTFNEFIREWGVGQMSEELTLPYDTVRKWAERNSIPAHTWHNVLAAAKRVGIKLTADDLVLMAAD